MSGYEVSKQVREQKDPQIANLKLLAFSSSVTKRIKMFKESGFDGFLPKPIQRHTLITMLKRLLGEAGEEIEAETTKDKDGRDHAAHAGRGGQAFGAHPAGRGQPDEPEAGAVHADQGGLPAGSGQQRARGGGEVHGGSGALRLDLHGRAHAGNGRPGGDQGAAQPRLQGDTRSLP